MTELNLPYHGYGRFLMDSLSLAATVNPEAFGWPAPEDDTARFPEMTDDPLLLKGIERIFETYEQAEQCEHILRALARLNEPGLKVVPEGVYLGCPVFAFAAAPHVRLCEMCWRRAMADPQMTQLGGRPCHRCKSEPLPSDPEMVLTPYAHLAVVSFVCGSCVADLKGVSHE